MNGVSKELLDALNAYYIRVWAEQKKFEEVNTRMWSQSPPPLHDINTIKENV